MKLPTKYLTIVSILILFVLAGCATPQAMTPAVLPAATAQPAAQATAPASQNSSIPTSSPAASDPSGTSANSSSGNLRFSIVAGNSSVDYRVREQLARLNFPSDAIGKTGSITGSLTIQPDGTIDSSSSKFVVDISTITSDSGMRDNYVRRNILQSDQFPQVTFVPTQISGLASPLPQSGNFSFQLTGNLSVRDVTKPVTWDVTGQIQNGQITAQATTTFTFEDFNLNQPRVPVVLSVEDKITLEANLVLTQS